MCCVFFVFCLVLYYLSTHTLRSVRTDYCPQLSQGLHDVCHILSCSVLFCFVLLRMPTLCIWTWMAMFGAWRTYSAVRSDKYYCHCHYLECQCAQCSILLIFVCIISNCNLFNSAQHVHVLVLVFVLFPTLTSSGGSLSWRTHGHTVVKEIGYLVPWRDKKCSGVTPVLHYCSAALLSSPPHCSWHCVLCLMTLYSSYFMKSFSALLYCMLTAERIEERGVFLISTYWP